MSEFDILKQEILDCRICKERFGFEPVPIFRGKKNAVIMQISQAPSIRVQECGLPFHDASGKKLKEEWYQISEECFYDEDLFYITSIGHCYPGKASSGDKKPPYECAKRWLNREMEIVDNDIYIVIGKIAASYLFPGSDFTSLVFHDQQLNHKPAYVLPHPSPLNRKWCKDHPEFDESRMPYIRYQMKQALQRATKNTP